MLGIIFCDYKQILYTSTTDSAAQFKTGLKPELTAFFTTEAML